MNAPGPDPARGIPADPEPVAAPPALELEDLPAGLFGATAGTVRPVPLVYIAGVLQATGTTSGTPAGQVALDGLSVSWGRDDLLDQPEPSTARLALFDATRTWAVNQNLHGKLVELRWQVGAETFTFFRGRIVAPVQVAPRTAGGVDGALVSLTCTSVLTDLANRIPPDAWPAETMGQRRTRIYNSASDVLAAVDARTFWMDPQVSPVAADDQRSIYDHLLSLYDACGGNRFHFDNDSRWTSYIGRRYFSSRGLARLWWEQTPGVARAGRGAFIQSTGITFAEGASALPAYLDGQALESDPAEGFTRPASAGVTRVQVTHKDSGASYAARTVTRQVGGRDEALMGSRAVRLDTILAWNSWADLLADDLTDIVRHEGAAWQFPPVRWQTRKTGGFENIDQVRLLLYGAEKNSLIFFQRTYLPRFGLPPLFGIMGGTIGYRAGGWDVEMVLSPLVYSFAQKQHAVTWEELDGSTPAIQVQWWDTPHPKGMHESVTYEDMAHVCAGLSGVVGPDVGWDR